MSTPAEWEWLPIVESLVPAFFGLVGVLAGGRLSRKLMVTQLAAEAENEKLTRRRERLEELYLGISLWRGEVLARYRRYTLAMRGEATFDYALKLDTDIGPDFDHRRISMNAEVYFASGVDQITKANQIATELRGIVDSYRAEHARGELWSHPHANQMDKCLDDFHHCSESYLDALTAHIRKLI